MAKEKEWKSEREGAENEIAEKKEEKKERVKERKEERTSRNRGESAPIA